MMYLQIIDENWDGRDGMGWDGSMFGANKHNVSRVWHVNSLSYLVLFSPM